MATPVFAQPGPEEAAQCEPGEALRPPSYPADMIRRGISGQVVLDLTIDACGRVLDARLMKSDKQAFNEAALASVEGVTLSEVQRGGAVDGRVQLPVDFKLGPNMSYQKVDWPSTHKKPRYVLDDLPMIYATPEEANAAIKAPPDQFWPSPYGLTSRFVQVGEPGSREFWLFIFKNQVASLAAQYVPVIVEGEPVVRLSLRCSDAPEACLEAQKILLKGLPFAKAKK